MTTFNHPTAMKTDALKRVGEECALFTAGYQPRRQEQGWNIVPAHTQLDTGGSGS